MPSFVNPAAATNAFQRQVGLGAQMRAADQAEEMNALAIDRMRREEAAAKQPKYDPAAFGKVGSIAAQIAGLPDPVQKRAAFKMAISQNGSLFDTMGMPSAEALAKLDTLDDMGLDATLAKLAEFAPRSGPTEVTAGNSLVRPDGKGGYESVYTAPSKAAAGGDDGFSLSPGQVRFNSRGERIAGVAAETKPADNSQTFTQENSLRDEYDKQTGNYGGLLESFETIKTLGQNSSPAGDIAMVAAFMRAVDPGSRVTGAEQATAENAGGVPAVMRGLYNQLIGEGSLSPKMRADFMAQAENLVQGRARAYKAAREKFTNLAKRYNLNAANIIGDELSISGSTKGPPAKTATGATVSNW